MKTVTKDADEYLTCYFDFNNVMEVFDSLTSVSVTTSSVNIVADTNTNFAPIVEYDSSDNPVYSTDGKLVEVHLSSGVSGNLYSIQVTATTTAGFKYMIPFLVIVQ